MASTPKKSKFEEKDTASAEGFLHNVTPLKLAKNKSTKYFNCVIQERTEYNDMVCFQGDLQQKMVDYEKNR